MQSRSLLYLRDSNPPKLIPKCIPDKHPREWFTRLVSKEEKLGLLDMPDYYNESRPIILSHCSLDPADDKTPFENRSKLSMTFSAFRSPENILQDLLMLSFMTVRTKFPKLAEGSFPREINTREAAEKLLKSHQRDKQYHLRYPSGCRVYHNEMNFFEVIRDTNQKPHFDFDLGYNLETKDFFDYCLANPDTRILTPLTCAICLVLESFDLILDPSRVMIFTSSGKNKISYHIVLSDYHHNDHLEARKSSIIV